MDVTAAAIEISASRVAQTRENSADLMGECLRADLVELGDAAIAEWTTEAYAALARARAKYGWTEGWEHLGPTQQRLIREDQRSHRFHEPSELAQMHIEERWGRRNLHSDMEPSCPRCRMQQSNCICARRSYLDTMADPAADRRTVPGLRTFARQDYLKRQTEPRTAAPQVDATRQPGKVRHSTIDREAWWDSVLQDA